MAICRDLEADGMQIGRHLILKHRGKPHVNAELFEDYLRSVFLPHSKITRIMKDLREEDAVLLMDNCSPHITAGVIELLSTARVRVVAFAPQTTYHANLPSSRFDFVWRSEKTRSGSIAPRRQPREYPIHQEGVSRSQLPDDDDDDRAQYMGRILRHRCQIFGCLRGSARFI
jgi:hypothetical protein